jgi:hypothetical protein
MIPVMLAGTPDAPLLRPVSLMPGVLTISRAGNVTIMRPLLDPSALSILLAFWACRLTDSTTNIPRRKQYYRFENSNVPPVSLHDHVRWATYLVLLCEPSQPAVGHPTGNGLQSRGILLHPIPRIGSLKKKANAYVSPRRAQDAYSLAEKTTTDGRLYFIKLSMQYQVRPSVLIYSKSMSCAIAADRVVLGIEIV